MPYTQDMQLFRATKCWVILLSQDSHHCL